MNILVSACLLGTPCRYDGASKPHPAVLRLRSEGHTLIPVCPEVMGGLPTPRIPSERQGDRVVRKDGVDVTENYEKGAETALKEAREHGCTLCILKEKSPSCGKGRIYDGTFSGTLKSGNGTTVDLLLQNGYAVIGESEIEGFFDAKGREQ